MSVKYKYGTGLSNVGSYQVSGKPFVNTATAPISGAGNFQHLVFPSVTKEITIINGGATGERVRVAFSSNGLKDHLNNYILVQPSVDGCSDVTLNVKATELYLMCDINQTPRVSVYAALTGIPSDRVDNISPSGSNWAGSEGIG